MLRYSYVYRVEYTYCWGQGQELDSNLFPIPWSSPLYSRPPRLRSLRLNPHHLLSLFPFLLLPSLCSCRRRPWPASPTSSTSTSPTPRRRSSPSTYGTYGNVLLVNPHATPLLPRRPERTDLAGRRPPFHGGSASGNGLLSAAAWERRIFAAFEEGFWEIIADFCLLFRPRRHKRC